MYHSDLKHDNKALEEKLHTLYGLRGGPKVAMGFRPAHMALLERLGNPHLNLPPVIHVAGTNGKGSTIAFMRAMLEAAGYRVHVYTSPHLVRFNERIRLAGALIEDKALEALIDEALDLNNGADLSFFEVTTAIAFAAFARTPADFTLLEVGMGGRLDCTNVVPNPAVTVITPISYDHMEFLGNTLQAIAAEKAGIMKPNAPCIIGPQDPEAVNALVDNVLKGAVSLFRYGPDWFTEVDPHRPQNQIRFRWAGSDTLLPLPNLVGDHQIANAGTALAALKILEKSNGFSIPETALSYGLQNALWPARLQKLDFVPAPGWAVWLDGGHNADAGRILATQARHWQEEDGKPLHLVMAMLSHKNPEGFLKPLLPFIESVHVIDIPDEPKSLKAADLAALLQDMAPALPVTQASNMEEACAAITGQNANPGRILVAGSLYLAGHILRTHGIPS